jgi:hypothetical protein
MAQAGSRAPECILIRFDTLISDYDPKNVIDSLSERLKPHQQKSRDHGHDFFQLD